MITTMSRIGIAAPVLSSEEAKNVLECLETNWISSKGRFINEFEKEFAAAFKVKHAIAVTNGTVALHLSLAAAGVSAGDEVILPTFTMIACANVVKFQGATPVLVDSEPVTWNLDLAEVERKITPRTKAVMPVHIYGHPVDMDKMRTLASKHGLRVIEDCAEAHGALYRNSPVGGLSDFGAFSFYANKIITTGEGGMVTTNDDKLAEMARSLRDQGYDYARRKWLIHDKIGFNYRLTNLQAAVGLAQLGRLEEFVAHHRKIASVYASHLRGVAGITLPPEEPWARNVYWMYTILVSAQQFGLTKDDLMVKLEAEGIETRSAFRPIHAQPPYEGAFRGQSFPVADRLAKEGVNLPSGNNTTEEEAIRVCQAIIGLSGGR